MFRLRISATFFLDEIYARVVFISTLSLFCHISVSFTRCCLLWMHPMHISTHNSKFGGRADAHKFSPICFAQKDCLFSTQKYIKFDAEKSDQCRWNPMWNVCRRKSIRFHTESIAYIKKEIILTSEITYFSLWTNVSANKAWPFERNDYFRSYFRCDFDNSNRWSSWRGLLDKWIFIFFWKKKGIPIFIPKLHIYRQDTNSKITNKWLGHNAIWIMTNGWERTKSTFILQRTGWIPRRRSASLSFCLPFGIWSVK